MKNRKSRLTEDGLPRDGREWRVEDWATLFHGLEAIKRKIRERHENDEATNDHGREEAGV